MEVAAMTKTKKKEVKMKPDKETIKELIKNIGIYNKATTAEEGFRALGSCIKIGEKLKDKNETKHKNTN